MGNLFYFSFLSGVCLLCFGVRKQRLFSNYHRFLKIKNKQKERNALFLKFWNLFYSQSLGLDKKSIAIVLLCILATLVLNHLFLQISAVLMLFVGAGVGVYGVNILQKKQIANDFESNFPKLLVTLNGAISAGNNITQALNDCSNSIDGVLRQELKIMTKSLEIGEDPSKVFQASYQRLPFKSYYFFLTALLVSLKSGAKLKEIISRLSIADTKAKAIEKKKNAMTSEARMSSKITASIPFFFLFVMKFVSPENFDFIMNDESGRYILYYFLGSEFIGILLIAFLMRKI